MENYSPYEASIAQQVYAKTNGAPLFAPKSGVCWSCNRNIYSPYQKSENWTTGITLAKATSSLITGCPHCNRSYCD